jgi:hypothetical protein
MSNNIKINWENIPEEYKWFAIDQNKVGNFYTEEPRIYEYESSWTFIGNSGNFTAGDYEGCVTDWKATLQQRPSVNTTINTELSKTFDISIQRTGELSDIQITGKLSKQQIAKIMEIAYE